MSGPGSRGRRYVVIGALLVIITGGAALGVWAILAGPDRSKRHEDTAGEFMPYKCAQCGHEFRVTPEEYEEFKETVAPNDPGAARLLHCPECGGKHCCVVMTPCPVCGKLYVPYGAKIAAKLERREDVPEDLPNICPHCKTDINEYWQNMPRKRR